MSAAAALLDRLGRPGDIRLGAAQPEAIARLPTGLATLDEALGGGLPRGRVTELAGPPGTGRTGLALAIAAHATRCGETIAWVDPEDALDPEVAAAAGVDLARMLWVRPHGVPDAFRAAEILLGAGGFGLVVLDVGIVLDVGLMKMKPGAALPHPAWGPGGAASAACELERRARSARAPHGPSEALARAAERTRSTLLVITSRREGGTFAALGLELTVRRVRWSGGPGRLALLEGIDARVTVARSRVGHPGQALVLRQACA